MLKNSCADCLDLSLVISAQFIFEMCVAVRNRKESQSTSHFGVQGHPRSLLSVPIESACITSHWSLIVTLALHRTEIRWLIGWTSQIFPTPFSFCIFGQDDPIRICEKSLGILKLESSGSQKNLVILISSMPVGICTRFHTRQDTNGKITTFRWVPLFGSLTLSCVGLLERKKLGLELLKSTLNTDNFIYRLSWSISSHVNEIHSSNVCRSPEMQKIH